MHLERCFMPRPQFVLPEMGAHMFLSACFLLGFQIIALILNLPLIAWNVNKRVLLPCHTSGGLFS